MSAAGDPADPAGPDLGLAPLTARSVLLSVLLGTHPPELPVRVLVRAGALFGVPDGTVRVALSRMTADGDVTGGGGRYRLAGRLLDRQRRQDEGRAASTLPWDGSWELAVADPDTRGAAGRAELAAALRPLRLAEWRDGLWARPANLQRGTGGGGGGARSGEQAARVQARLLRTGPLDDPSALAAQLWDLTGWGRRALDLLAAMDGDPDPARHFTVSAATVAHLRDDPLLPLDLLPPDWPGDDLRRRYRSFEAELRALLRLAGDDAG